VEHYAGLDVSLELTSVCIVDVEATADNLALAECGWFERIRGSHALFRPPR
jgi:hypothetical protein